MTREPVTISRRWLVPSAWVLAAIIAIAVLLKTNATAREVAGESALAIFQVLTAPFVLETTLAFLGLCAVLAINQYRLQKDGDEWVYLEKQTDDPANRVSADDPPHRHDAVVWQEKPVAFDTATAAFDVIEGYLELGLSDDAITELESLPERSQDSGPGVDLWVRALVMTGKFPEATSSFEKGAREHPDRAERMAETALTVALWLDANKKDSSEIDGWLQRSRCLDACATRRLPAGHPFHARAQC